MKKHFISIPFVILIVFSLLFSFLSFRQAAASEYDPCPSGTGPGGITAGDYDPTTLTQDQRQWLFTIFGNAGTAPVGYGGQRCGQTPPIAVPQPAWFGQSCGTSYTGPGGLRAGGYDPTTLTQDQRQWLFEVFGNNGQASVGYGGSTCSWQETPPSNPDWFGQGCDTSFTGPSGLRAGGYDPTTLTQDQRQWLFEVFGNNGQASVGYGGSTCTWQDGPPPCPTGTGPDGITAGSYDPTKLTQAQRQWLFEKFGHTGTASVGYGGEACTGGTPYTPGTTGGPTTITCPTGTGPDSITAGSYDPTKLTQDQRQWLFEKFGHTGTASVGYGGETCSGGTPYTPGTTGGPTTITCPTGTGPDGITAGSYDPTKLTQDQRQWLFEKFGHTGTASVGYGGETCSGGTPYTPGTTGGPTTITCPTGTGPDGIAAGSYDPTKLTPDQRQWLFEKFGHSGTAPVGYGGETCTGGTPYTPGSGTNPPGDNPGGTPGGSTPSVDTHNSMPALLGPSNNSSWEEGSTLGFIWFGDGSSYLLEINDGPYDGSITCDWQPGTSCAVGPLLAGTYTWHVKARNSSNQEGPWSQLFTFTVQPGQFNINEPVYSAEGQQPVKTCSLFCQIKLFVLKSWNQAWGIKPTPPPATSAPPSTTQSPEIRVRSEILSRANVWMRPPNVSYDIYSSTDGYRQDCSGFVSYAWGLHNNSGQPVSPNTVGLGSYGSAISLSNIQPGDAIDNMRAGMIGHVVLFVSWSNKDQGKFIAYEENGAYGATRTNLTISNISGGLTIAEYENYAPGPYTVLQAPIP